VHVKYNASGHILIVHKTEHSKTAIAFYMTMVAA